MASAVGGGTAKIPHQVFKSLCTATTTAAILVAFSRETAVLYVRRTWEETNLTAGKYLYHRTSISFSCSWCLQSSQWSCISFLGENWKRSAVFWTFAILVFNTVVKTPACWYKENSLRLEFSAFGVFSHSYNLPRPSPQPSTHSTMMAVAAAQKNREMFAIKKSYSIEVSHNHICDVVPCLQ